MRILVLCAALLGLMCGPLWAFDSAKVAPYGPLNLCLPNADQMTMWDAITCAAGRVRDAGSLSAAPDASAASGTLNRLLADRATLSGPNNFPLAAPNWNTYRTPFTPFMATIGGPFPVGALAGGNTVGTTHAITGAVTIPETNGNNSRAVFAAGVAGYARSFNSKSPNQGAVGIYGAVLCGADPTNLNSGTSCWGSNLIVGNLADLSEPQANKGHHNMNMWGLEIDVNVQKRPDGSTPGGNALGLDVVGSSAVQPLGNFRAINLQASGVYAGVRWKDGIFFNDGAADNGITFGSNSVGSGYALTMGPVSASGPSGAQNFQWLTRKPDNGIVAAFLRTDPYANMFLIPGGSSNIILAKSDGSKVLSAGDSGVLINVDGTERQVTIGPPDSCGTGFRCLRVPN
ncbi:hypothetical protein [Methylobacterium sp. A52T]